MHRTETDPPGPRFRLIFLAPVFLLIALLCWALASPVGASPDDDFHLASIWCGLGDRAGLCESVPGHPEERAVPRGVLLADRCFEGKPNQSAACQKPKIGNPNHLIATTRGNFAATSYPPVYYSFMSLFVSHNVNFSVVLLRLINALLFTAIVTLLFVLLPLRRRATLVWAWAAGLVPLGIFLLASNNPSAWAIISGGSLWLALVGYFETTGGRKIGLGVLSAVLALMGAGARSDSAVYVVIAVVIAVLLTARRERQYLLSAILPAAMIVVAAAFYLSARQSGISSNGFGGSSLPSSMSKLTLAGLDFVNAPSLWAGAFGTWPLGWLDTAMPGIVSVGCIFAFCAIVFTGLRSYTVRKLIAFLLVLAAVWAIPAWILVQGNQQVGQSVQPRYIYPLLLMLAGIALIQVSSSRFRLNRFQLILVTVALVVANAVALHVNIRRYVTGLDAVGFDLNHGVEWWWNLPFSPMVIWFVGSVAFAATIWISVREVTAPTRPVRGREPVPATALQ